MNPFLMHVNFGEAGKKFATYGRSTVDSICKMAAEIGYDGIEFRSNVPADLEGVTFDEYLNQIAEGKKKYGLSQITFGLGLAESMNPDKEIRVKSINEACEKAKKAMDTCGTTIFNCFGKMIKSPIAVASPLLYELHGSAAATQQDWDLIVDSFQQFSKLMEPTGAKFAFETHMNYIHDLPESVRKLVDLIDCPNIGINMDFGNSAFFTTPPSLEDTIDLYKDKLFYVHLKNSIKVMGAERSVSVALSEGLINHNIYFTKLKEIGYNGPLTIEATRPGDRRWYAEQDFKYAKEVYNSIF